MLASLAPERHPEPVRREGRQSPQQPQSWPTWVRWTLVCRTLGHGLHNAGGRRGLRLSRCSRGRPDAQPGGPGTSPPGPQATSAGSIPLSGQLCSWEGRVGGRWPGVSSGEWTEGPGREGSQSAPGRRSLVSQPPVSSQTSGPNPRVAKLSLPVWDERRQPALAPGGRRWAGTWGGVGGAWVVIKVDRNKSEGSHHVLRTPLSRHPNSARFVLL